MSLPHKKMREAVFLILYSLEQEKESHSSLESLVCEQLSLSKKNFHVAKSRVSKIEEYLTTVDQTIRKLSQKYPYDHMASVERNVLRLGAYEILFDSDTPPKVAIAEAIRICRKFSSPSSAEFVNAVLDQLYKESIGEHPSSDIPEDPDEG